MGTRKCSMGIYIRGTLERISVHYECAYGHIPIVECLFCKCASIEAKSSKDKRESLHLASFIYYHAKSKRSQKIKLRQIW